MRTGLSRARQAHSSLVQRRSRNYRTAPIGRAAGRLVRCDRGVLRGRAQQTGPANLRVMPRPAWRSRARGVVRGDPKSNVEGARQAGFTAFWFTGDEDVPPRRTRLFGVWALVMASTSRHGQPPECHSNPRRCAAPLTSGPAAAHLEECGDDLLAAETGMSADRLRCGPWP